jgi:hypothetical protein
MLVIDAGEQSSCPLIEVAFGRNVSARRLCYWEQVSALDHEGEEASLVVDGCPIQKTETIFLCGMPRFQYPERFSDGDRDFAWSEWSAALEAVIFVHPGLVPNRNAILGASGLLTNSLVYKERFCDSLDLQSVTERTGTRREWLLVTTASTYTLGTQEGILTPASHAAAQRALKDYGIDFAILELCGDQRPQLLQVHLMPPLSSPRHFLEILVASNGQ